MATTLTSSISIFALSSCSLLSYAAPQSQRSSPRIPALNLPMYQRHFSYRMLPRRFKMSTSAMSLGTIARCCCSPCGMSNFTYPPRLCDDVKHSVLKLRWTSLWASQYISFPSSSCRRRDQIGRGISTRALSLGSSGRNIERTAWDEAADGYFYRASSNVISDRDIQFEDDNGRRSSRSNGTDRRASVDVNSRREASSNDGEFQAKPVLESDLRHRDSSNGVPKGGRSASLENMSGKSERYERGGGWKSMQGQKSHHVKSKIPRNWGYSREGSAGPRRDDWKWTRPESVGRMRRRGSGEESDEGAESDGDSRWLSSNLASNSPKLRLEGQVMYGVAPILSALSVSRRKFFCLYMQENLVQNIEKGKRKDKAAIFLIEKTARDMGLEVRTSTKHDLNLLVDNRPHQGLVMDASPLEFVQVDVLDFPSQSGDKSPVWVALDEVTDPQNFGAVLRSTYFLGAEGVIVCAKNSAPLSAVVSKASAGAMEVMDVHYCKNMVKFLSRCQENGWRVVGASAERASVAVEELPNGVPTILVLGNEGTGLRTNVKNACNHLVSIGGHSRQHLRSNSFSKSESADFDSVEGGKQRSSDLIATEGSVFVDSLNVSVAAGIMLHELLSSRKVEIGHLTMSSVYLADQTS